MKSQNQPLYLGEFEQLVLLTLLRLGETAYGVTIWEELCDRSERDVSLSAVYTTLTRLEDKGFVASRVGEPTPERGGRRKKFFRLDPLGARALSASHETYRRMARGLERKLGAL